MTWFCERWTTSCTQRMAVTTVSPFRAPGVRSNGSPRSVVLCERRSPMRSEEHTSELQSQSNLVCRLLLEKKKNNKHIHPQLLSAHDIAVSTNLTTLYATHRTA